MPAELPFQLRTDLHKSDLHRFDLQHLPSLLSQPWCLTPASKPPHIVVGCGEKIFRIPLHASY